MVKVIFNIVHEKSIPLKESFSKNLPYVFHSLKFGMRLFVRFYCIAHILRKSN